MITNFDTYRVSIYFLGVDFKVLHDLLHVVFSTEEEHLPISFSKELMDSRGLFRGPRI